MMNRKFINIVLFSFAILSTISSAQAGTAVYAEGSDPEKAMEAATKAVEEAARKAKRCVSEYPSLGTCEQLSNGNWRCRGIRANHKGSCK